MNKRITSIDALRGADMLLLAGGGAILAGLARWGDAPALHRQLTHAAWGQPLTCWDMVMPLFIFIVGAGMPFAFAKYRSSGASVGRILWRVGRRCVCLFLLGMLVQGNLASADPSQMSLFCNTLQAIAEGYLIAAICLLCGGVRSQLAVCFGCLLLYWAALRFVPYAGHEGGRFLPHDNLAIWIDRSLQGHWQDGTPYSWILTSLAFGALTLLGVLGGQIIRLCSGRLRSIGLLAAAAAVCLIAGRLLALDTPIIKHIFTASMVLYSAGWCFALLALFHAIFDTTARTAPLSKPLIIFGTNAILAYLLTQTPGMGHHSLWYTLTFPLFGGLSSLAGSLAAPVFSLLSFLALFLLLSFLHSHKIYLRV